MLPAEKNAAGGTLRQRQIQKKNNLFFINYIFRLVKKKTPRQKFKFGSVAGPVP